jgi:polyisoprenoid-binding protein YceI
MSHFLTRSIGTTLAVAVAVAGMASVAPAATIAGDLAHSSAEFVVTHLTISQVHGTIPVTSWQAVATADYVPQSIEATLDAAALTTGDTQRDGDLRGSDWLEVTKYPTITFVSTKITPGTNGAFTAVGNLTIHGVTKPATLQGQVLGSVVDNKHRTHVGYTATTSIDRRDFGLNWGKTMPGGQLIAAYPVTINLQAEGIVQP